MGFLLIGTFCFLHRNTLNVKPLLEGSWWALFFGHISVIAVRRQGEKLVGIVRFPSPKSGVSGYTDIKHEHKNSFIFHGGSSSFFVLLVFH